MVVLDRAASNYWPETQRGVTPARCRSSPHPPHSTHDAMPVYQLEEVGHADAKTCGDLGHLATVHQKVFDLLDPVLGVASRSQRWPARRNLVRLREPALCLIDGIGPIVDRPMLRIY